MSWTTIHSVTYPSEAHTIKLQLEIEGFDVFLKDELTVQVDNFYSNAIGGVKIQVPQEQAKEAYQLLLNLGYIFENKPARDSFLKRFYSFTDRIPLLNKFLPEIRLLAIVGLLLLIILLPIFYIQSSTKSQLEEFEWCVEVIYYQGEVYEPNTLSDDILTLRMVGECSEYMVLSNNQLNFPGIGTPRINSSYIISDNTLSIRHSDTLGFCLDRDYLVEINGDNLLLTSVQTQIVCTKQQEFDINNILPF